MEAMKTNTQFTGTIENTLDRLPGEGEWCLFWHNNHRLWLAGQWYPEGVNGPAHFSNNQGEAAYISDGTATWWMASPPPPPSDKFDLSLLRKIILSQRKNPIWCFRLLYSLVYQQEISSADASQIWRGVYGAELFPVVEPR